MATIFTTANIGNYHGLKFGNDGKPRISFSAAETARIKDQSGQWVDGGTTWFNVTLFGGAAEALDAQIAAAGGKGKVVFGGRMSTRAYEHNGEKRESLDVVADTVAIVPRNTGGGQAQGGKPQWNNQPASDPWAAPQPQANAQQWGNGPANEPAF
jgi:single-stranded DNA-binding protein